MTTILFNSESPLVLESLGKITTASLLSRYESIGLNIPGGGVIDLSNVDQEILDELVYVVPQRGRINFITAQFSVRFAFFVSNPIKICVQVYTSLNNIFVPVIPPISLGSITSPVYASDRVIYEIKSLNIPVITGERVLLAFYASSSSNIMSDIIGYSKAELIFKEEPREPVWEFRSNL